MAQTKYLIQRFTGGMNRDMDAAAIDLTRQQDQVVEVVANVSNGVFERGLFRTRPQLVTPVNLLNLAANNNVIAACKLPFPSNDAVATYRIGGMALTFDTAIATYRLWKLNAEVTIGRLFDVTEITGPGITAAGWDNFFFSNTVCNRVVLIAGYKGGLIRWDPTTTVYTLIGDATYNFVTKQNSRAVGAYKNTGAVLDPITLGASKSGDEAVWVPASIEAYQTTPADISDNITGIGVAKGILVIPRTFGFHLGYPTGTFPAIYNIVQHSDDAIGCANPATFCIYKNVCYFVSTNNVHTFDLVDITDIGEGIVTEILSTLAANGGTLRGFISSSYKTDSQPTYNLYIDAPTATAVTANSLPLWQYNITERKWSRHFAAAVAGSYSHLWHAFYYRFIASTGLSVPINSTIAQLNRKPGVIPQWKYTSYLQGNGAEGIVTSFTTGKLTISAPVFEATITRIMLVYISNLPVAPTFNISIDSTLNGVTTNTARTIDGLVASVWLRQWIGSVACVGQMFQISVAVAGGSNDVLIKEMLVEFTDTSKERG